jgi:hypothetical protein
VTDIPFDHADLVSPAPLRLPEVVAAQPSSVDWSHGLLCAALGGIASFFLCLVPFAIFGPAFLAGGAFAAFLYYRRTGINPTRGVGARLGAASGGFAFLFAAILVVASVVYSPEKIREALAAQLNVNHYNPEDIRRVMDILDTREGLTFFVIFSLLIAALIFVIGSAVGGAWYSASRKLPRI